MATIHQGVNGGIPDRWKKITIVPAGEGFADADAFTFGAREGASMTSTESTYELYDQSKRQWGNVLMIDYKSVQANINMVRNAYLITNRQLNVKAEDAATSNIYYFITDTPINMGAKFKYTLNKSTRMIEVTLQTLVTKASWDTILGNVGASLTGESGGTPIGISGGGYIVANEVPPNWTSLTLTNSAGSAEFGANVDVSLELESFCDTADTDDQSRFIHNKYKFTISGRCIDDSVNSDLAFNTDIAEDTTLVAVDANGDTYTFNHLRMNYKINKTDKGRFIAFSAMGSCIANPVEATPTSIIFTSTSITFNPLGDN